MDYSDYRDQCKSMSAIPFAKFRTHLNERASAKTLRTSNSNLSSTWLLMGCLGSIEATAQQGGVLSFFFPTKMFHRIRMADCSILVGCLIEFARSGGGRFMAGE